MSEDKGNRFQSEMTRLMNLVVNKIEGLEESVSGLKTDVSGLKQEVKLNTQKLDVLTG